MLKKLNDTFRRFMYGRYGSDQLNMLLLGIGIVMALLSNFTSLYFLGLVSYIPLILAIFRMYSRNLYKRRQENQKFMALIGRLKDRDHRYYACPICHKKVRVPKGMGKISIRCPGCNNRFTRKS